MTKFTLALLLGLFLVSCTTPPAPSGPPVPPTRVKKLAAPKYQSAVLKASAATPTNLVVRLSFPAEQATWTIYQRDDLSLSSPWAVLTNVVSNVVYLPFDTSVPAKFFTTVASKPATVSVELNWSSVSNVTGYFVYYGITSGSYSIKVDAGNVQSLIIPNLVSDSTYYFAVTAYSATGLESDYSNEVSFHVPVMPPTTWGVLTHIDIVPFQTPQFVKRTAFRLTSPKAIQFFKP